MTFNMGAWGFQVGQMCKTAAETGWELGGDDDQRPRTLAEHRAESGHTGSCACGECDCGAGCPCDGQ